ncbi:MAG: exosortase J [Terracidiphilus sp.]
MISNRYRVIAMTENPQDPLNSAGEAACQPEGGTARPSARSLALGCTVAILCAAGCLGIGRELALLWNCWTTDPLRSIGMLIPPASLVLTLRVWRQSGWQMRGSWWGLAAIGLSFVFSLVRESALFLVTGAGAVVSLIPLSLPVYFYASGIVLLFAGQRVWRIAWFPLGLLLLSQPVPILSSSMIDLPLQSISAQVARSFAALIHFAPTTPQLRLMFSPDFGMFIAPGCDGIRGAVALGYVALVLGYLKRVSFRRWAAYVVGGVLLGYVFNFIRLCALVLYYRIALGHPALEGVARQADYVIGSCLFLIAILIFLRLARLKQQAPAPSPVAPGDAGSAPRIRGLFLKCAAFAAALAFVLALPSSAIRTNRTAPAATAPPAARFPRQIGAFTLARTWDEQSGGKTLVESAAYSAPGSDEIVLAVWVAPDVSFHDANACWLARGLEPELLTAQPFVTAQGQPIEFSTGFYSDGITDSIVVSASCTPGSCSQAQQAGAASRFRFIVLKPRLNELAATGAHPVPIMIRIDRLHSAAPKSETHGILSAEAQRFLSAFDPLPLSQAFQ